MFSEKPKVYSEREKAWQDKMREIEKMADVKGMGIDEQIKETIAALNLNGFDTNASCEGHINRGYPAPWMRVSVPGQPKWRFVGEEEIFKEIADKYNATFDDVMRAVNEDAYTEAMTRSAKNEESEEYTEWMKRNKWLQTEIETLLVEFYKGREVIYGKQIVTEEGESGFRIHNGGKDYEEKVQRIRSGDNSNPDLTENEERELTHRLETYQNEMRSFTQFLKSRFLDSRI